MLVGIQTNLKQDGFYSAKPLPPNETTNVRVEAVGSNVTLYLNNTFDSSAILNGVRFSGQANCIVSSTSDTPALASIGSIQMTPISAIQFVNPSDFNGPLSKLKAYNVDSLIPKDYALSFDITPTGSSSDWRNILHYNGDPSTNRKMTGIFEINDY